MKKVFLDADVIIDFLTMRQPFGEAAKTLFQLGLDEKVELYTSALALANANYIIGSFTTPKAALAKIKKLVSLVKICEMDQQVVDLAAQSRFSDFEDALQNYSAEEAHIDIIATRNIKDYKHSSLAVLTPGELLVRLSLS